MDSQVKGQHVTLVFLPGLDGTEVFYRPLLATLPAWIESRVIVYPDRAPYDYEGLLERLRKELQDVASCYVVASSFAGPLAVMLAGAEPGKVRGLILSATFLRAPVRRSGGYRPVATTPVVWSLRVARRLPIWILRSRVDAVRLAKRETWQHVSARSLAGRGRAILRVDVRKTLDAVSQPVLCVAYEHDRVVPRNCAEEIMKHSARARLAMLPGGHLAMFTDPGPLAAEIEHFVGEGPRNPVEDQLTA